MTRNAVPRSSPTSCSVQMCGCESCEMARASRSNRARRSGSDVSAAERTFECDRSVEAGVAGAVDLAHPAGAERRQNLVRAEADAGGEGHERTILDCQLFSFR